MVDQQEDGDVDADDADAAGAAGAAAVDAAGVVAAGEAEVVVEDARDPAL